MPLTTQQEIALFQMLEVPWQPVVIKPAGADYLFYEKSDATTSIRQARQAILDYLAVYVYPNADALLVLVGYCNRWICIGTDTIVLQAGSAGNGVTGVTSDPERERLEIQRQVKGMVPFFRAHQEMARAASSGSSISICR